MKKFIAVACLVSTVAMGTGLAMADSIKGKLGVTGKMGLVLPADGDHNDTDAGLTGAVGLIYGLDDRFALEMDLTRSDFDSDEGDFDVTNLSIGAQYRFALADPQLTPFVGGGLGVLFSDGDRRDVDTTVGAYANAGVDYFLLKQLALTAEARLVVAPDVDSRDKWDGTRRGDFDPSSFSTTVGARYFFN